MCPGSEVSLSVRDCTSTGSSLLTAVLSEPGVTSDSTLAAFGAAIE